MTLSPGTCLGAYEVAALIGAGGMGEVYRARDTKLKRDVAIKVLPEALATDPEALARFEREARAVAALSHPNILAIFDSGRDGQIAYTVTELLDGETLRSRLEGGTMPRRKVLELARDVARGLAAAHDKGIVHRDLKPENLFVTRQGQAKILDFGLARTVVAPPGADTRSPTEAPRTAPGTLFGTAGYIAPEQLKGLPADARSDIFSFGAVLYEMLAGRRAFKGETSIETLNAILHDDAPEFPHPVPAALDRVVRRCLEKNPDERYRSAHDLAFDLELLSGLSTPTGRLPLTAAGGATLGRRLTLAAVVALGVASAFLAGRRSNRPTPPRYEQLTFRHGTIQSARFAPDGRTVLYSAAWDGGPLRIWAKTPESPEALPRELPDANLLAISSSGELALTLGCRFFIHLSLCQGTLARLPLAGGAPREVTERTVQADWSPHGTELALTHAAGDLFRLEFPPGKVLYETRGYVSDPRISPRGDLIAFFDHPELGDDRGSVTLTDLAGRRRTLSAGWGTLQGLAWSPTGEEVWFTGAKEGVTRALYAVSLAGRERPVTTVPGGITLQDISSKGRVLLTRDTQRSGIMVLAPGEKTERDLSWLEWSVQPFLSEDGKTLLFEEEGQQAGLDYSVCLRKTDGSAVMRLGEGEAWALSPDGRWVLARAPNPASPVLLLPTGTGERRTVGLPPGMVWTAGRFFADGKRLLMLGREMGRGWRLWVLSIDKGPPRPITPEGIVSGGMSGYFCISPEGHRVTAWLGGRLLLFPVEGGDPRPVPGAEEGDVPLRFSGDGRSLFVAGPPGALRLVSRIDIETGRRVSWKTLRPPDPTGIRLVDVISLTPDGLSYAYSYGRLLSDLFVADGLR